MYDKMKMFFHDFRVWPRVMCAFYFYLLYDVVQWFETVQNPTTQQVVLLTAFTGFIPVIFNMYVKSKSGENK